MSSRIGVAVMAVLLALYLVLVAQRAVVFIQTGEPLAVAIGVALLVLPLVGAWALGRELLFGARAQRLADRLGAEGGLPVDDLAKRPSGRPERAAADAEFPRYREAVEEAPEDWRAWYRLALAYDASGDRKRARQAVRNAIALERAASG
ncbi:MAG TPA: tetratricopeptide repeat protein [Naasia sp.]